VCSYKNNGRIVHEICIEEKAEMYITKAFSWDMSTLGFNFWEKLDIQWGHCLKKFRNMQEIPRSKITTCKSIW